MLGNLNALMVDEPGMTIWRFETLVEGSGLLDQLRFVVSESPLLELQPRYIALSYDDFDHLEQAMAANAQFTPLETLTGPAMSLTLSLTFKGIKAQRHRIQPGKVILVYYDGDSTSEM